MIEIITVGAGTEMSVSECIEGEKEMREIKLWKENKINQEWTITFEELTKRFYNSWMYSEFQFQWPLDRILRGFISGNEKDELNSVFDDNDYEELLGYVASREEGK